MFCSGDCAYFVFILKMSKGSTASVHGNIIRVRERLKLTAFYEDRTAVCKCLVHLPFTSNKLTELIYMKTDEESELTSFD